MSDFDKDLTPVLALASSEDLEPLVKYITEAKLTEALTKSDLYKLYTPKHTEYVELIEKEIRTFGGNSFLNLARGNGPAYIEVAEDVAQKLGATINKNSSIEEIEMALLSQIMIQSWEKMTPEEKGDLLKEMGIGTGVGSMPKALPIVALQAAIKASGFLAYKLAAIVANAIAKALLGRGLSFAATGTMMRGISIFAGPIGWVITGIWTLLDIAGPAYRVTIPCVVHIAMLRQQLSLLHCRECFAPYTEGTKFCPNCGAKIDKINA